MPHRDIHPSPPPHTANLKIWKKDYDRVMSLAKGAYNSTNMPEVQAESLYMLARVYHARDEMEQANRFYEKAVFPRSGSISISIWIGADVNLG